MYATSSCMQAYLVVLAVTVDHPVLAVGADLQFEGSDVVGLLRLLWDGALCSDACQNLQEVEVNLDEGVQRQYLITDKDRLKKKRLD